MSGARSTWSSSLATTTTSSCGPCPASATNASRDATRSRSPNQSPTSTELYDLTMDPLEEHNLAHPTHADEQSHALARTMLGLLTDQLAAKTPHPLSRRASGLPAARDRLPVNSASAPVGEPSSRTGEPLEAARSYRPERELTATHPDPSYPRATPRPANPAPIPDGSPVRWAHGAGPGPLDDPRTLFAWVRYSSSR